MTSQNSNLSETSGYIIIDVVKLKYIIEGEGIPCIPVGMVPKQIQPAFSSELKKYLKFIL